MLRGLALYSINRPVVTWLIMISCLVGGVWGYGAVGRLEDPSFTIKQAVVVTAYPGATAAEVATEISEPIEAAIQSVGEVNVVTSRNRDGLSEITVELQTTTRPDEVEQIWDKLRRVVGDARGALPDGASAPSVNDDFGDVYGVYYAVSAPGLSDAEIHRLSQFLRRELLTVDGVADVAVSGVPEEAIFVVPSTERIAALGVSPEAIAGAIANSDSVGAVGALALSESRRPIDRPEADDTVDEIQRLTIGVRGEIVNLSDLVEIQRGRVDAPRLMVRHNGVEAFTLGVSGVDGVNIVDVGEGVSAALAALTSEIPIGVEISPIYQQEVVVTEAIDGFVVSLGLSVGIVIGVLTLFMGWRAGVVVGATLLLTVLATLPLMAVTGVQMERISLGALIIAMGMLVDNAIVVAEGMQVAMRRGRASRDAAQEVAQKTSIPLLGATVIGVMAFAGIGLSPDETGEFLFSLFAVIAMSLMLSWALAVLVTPLLGHYFFERGEGGGDAYDGALFQLYARIVRRALAARWAVVGGLVGVTALCYVGFASVTQQFFPNSTAPLFYVHHQLGQGASVHATSESLERFEAWLRERPEVTDVTSFSGAGAARFLLTYSPAREDPSYGFLLVRVGDVDEIPAVYDAFAAFAAESAPEGETRLQRLVFGPNPAAEIEVRLSGRDPAVLRALSEEARAVLAAEELVRDVRVDWRERVFAIQPDYAIDRAQAAGVSRDDVAAALAMATDGLRIGSLQDLDRILPILVRLSDDERARQGVLLTQLVYSDASQSYVPLVQIVDGYGLEARDPIVHRRDRVLTLTVQADSIDGVTAETAFAEVQAALEAIETPVGYDLEFGGTFESSSQAQESLGQQVPISFLAMFLLTILLFGRLKQTFVIWLLTPMAVNGVAVGLLATGLPFTFTAILGLLSLAGMLIKNGIVLVEEIDLTRSDGRPLEDAIVEACVARSRPVILAAGTTILGMIPLLWDAFFESMAVTIMGGLAFATVLTLIAAPVFYAILMRNEERRAGVATAEAAAAVA